MYTLFIISSQEVKQYSGLSKDFARRMAYTALKRNNTVQLLTRSKKYVTLELKDFLGFEYGK